MTKEPGDLRRSHVANKSAKMVLGVLGTKLSTAEAELLEFVRGKRASEFTLSIGCRRGHWSVRFVAPGTVHAALEGFGTTFAKAWENQSPSWPAP